jgi:nicotinate phosphoribosyltransferase
MRGMNRSQLDIMYARAKVKLYDKLALLAQVDGLNLTDFGTRRRHSFLWQEHCVLTAAEVLGPKFGGTSNAYLAMTHDLEAKGTNAHELPMVLAALARTDADLKQAQYTVLEQWQNVYRGGLLVMLPDTFGTTQFLEGLSPTMARAWTGARPDSKAPIVGGEELVAFWQRADPANAAHKLLIFADGMDVHLPGQAAHGADIPTVHRHFAGRVRVGFGFGTMLTNDFIGCHPLAADAMKPISLVCKVQSADGRGAVKLSDITTKATGAPAEVARYRRVFGEAGMEAGAPPIV